MLRSSDSRTSTNPCKNNIPTVSTMETTNVASGRATETVNPDDRDNKPIIMEYEAEFLEDARCDDSSARDVFNYEDTCRVCANVRDHMIPIFEDEGAEHKLSVKIHKYLPIKVSATDSLPLKLCYHCAATLLAWHDLITGCLDAEKKLLRARAELGRNEANRSKLSRISPSDEVSKKIIDENAESTDGQILESSKNSRSSSRKIADEETYRIKYEETNSNAMDEENLAANESVDDPEPIAVEKLEITDAGGEDDGSRRIREGDESRATNRIEETIENVKHRVIGRKTTGRLKKFVPPNSNNCDDRKKRKTRLDKTSNFTTDETKSLDDCPEEISIAVSSPNRKKQNDSDVVSNVRTAQNHEKSVHDEIVPNITIVIDDSEKRHHKTPSGKKLQRIDAKMKKKNDKGPFTCDLCEKKFKLRESLKIHTRVHTGEKEFTCHVCGKQFVQTGCLRYHLKHVHDGIKNHRCDVCGRCFAMKSSMEDHRRSIHTGERPYVCDCCGKTFKTKSSLYIHNRIHTDEFGHECEYCKKLFRWRQQLIGHLTIHTGEKNHRCEVCGKAFGVKNHLTRHKRIHSIEKPYDCQQCGMSFGQKRYLATHQRSRHK